MLQFASKVNKKGEYTVFSERTRSQLNNTQDCYDKLILDLKSAAEFPKDPSQEQIERIFTNWLAPFPSQLYWEI
ncbi:hypothetical protein AYI68_g2184 [Smittium mucronatum]|uniref:Uncharacterized protein n=1 Tax=Smittium mucronatum TaxID=133383 RepID=A0A1R0H3F2_9FUNG|nr:hypothetical protein AYI68_g2184 [Smittium mucronatum]